MWIQLLGSEGPRARSILVLREEILKESAVSLVLPTFHDNGSLGPSPRPVVYSPLIPLWVTASRFLAGIGRLS